MFLPDRGIHGSNVLPRRPQMQSLVSLHIYFVDLASKCEASRPSKEFHGWWCSCLIEASDLQLYWVTFVTSHIHIMDFTSRSLPWRSPDHLRFFNEMCNFCPIEKSRVSTTWAGSVRNFYAVHATSIDTRRALCTSCMLVFRESLFVY